MKYFAIYDANGNIYAYTPSERGAKITANSIGGSYKEITDEDGE